MRPALQVPGELVAMAMVTCCQCSEEEGSGWLLGAAGLREWGTPDKGVPEPQDTCEQLCWCLAAGTAGSCLDFAMGGLTLTLSSLFFCPLFILSAALCANLSHKVPSLFYP